MRLNFNKRTFSIIIFALVILGIVNMFWGVNGLVKNMRVVKVVIIINDVKAGLEPVQTKLLSTTDSNEIKEVLDTLKKPILYKTFPNLGDVPSNTKDRIEMVIALHTDDNRLLEYVVTSQGKMMVKTINGKISSTNVSIFAKSNIKWFEQLMELYEHKEQNGKWIGK